MWKVANLFAWYLQQRRTIARSAAKSHGSGGRSCTWSTRQGKELIKTKLISLVYIDVSGTSVWSSCNRQVIAAEGEQKASRALREASEVIGDSPAALQLRYLQVKIRFCHYKLHYQLSIYNSRVSSSYTSHNFSSRSFLQTLNTISAEKNSTIVFPLPIDMLTYFMKALPKE